MNQTWEDTEWGMLKKRFPGRPIPCCWASAVPRRPCLAHGSETEVLQPVAVAPFPPWWLRRDTVDDSTGCGDRPSTAMLHGPAGFGAGRPMLRPAAQTQVTLLVHERMRSSVPMVHPSPSSLPVPPPLPMPAPRWP